jgi:hypothetical protein
VPFENVPLITGAGVVSTGTVTLTDALPNKDIDAVAVMVEVAVRVLVIPEPQTSTEYGLDELLLPAGLKSKTHSALPLVGELALVKL